jgi:hypothetical protein
VLISFGRNLLVNCPFCRRSADVHFADDCATIKQKCVCVHCGYSDERDVKSLPAYSYRSDWHKCLDLWLQTLAAATCSGRSMKDISPFLRAMSPRSFAKDGPINSDGQIRA